MAIINITNESPGVYDVLIDQSQFSPSVSETKAGIIGVADKGPIGVPTLITGQNEFIETFGTPSTDGYGGLAAYNLLGQINQVWFTRIATSAAKSSSGSIISPATSAELVGSNFANYSFGFGQDNNQFLISVNGNSVTAVEFEDGTYTTDDVVTILSALLLGEATVENVSGNIEITSVLTGSSSIINLPSSDAITTLGFTQGTTTGIDATAAFRTTTNSQGTFIGTPFSSTSVLSIKFDDDVNKVVTLTGSFIDGIDNVVDLTTEWNNFAANSVDTTLGNSAVVSQEKITFTSPLFGSDSVVEILNTTTSDVISVLGLSGMIGVAVSGTAATSASVTNSKKHGYNLSSSTSLKFLVDLLPEKTITFNTSGNPAHSTLYFTSGTAVTTGTSVLVSDWTFNFEAASGNLNLTTKNFDIAVGSDNIESYSNLATAINLFVNDDVTAVLTSPVGPGGSGDLELTAVSPGRNGNSIAFNTSEITAHFVSKDPADETLGYGNGSVLTDLSQAKITDVVSEINRQAGSIYAVASEGKVHLRSETTGGSSSIRITGANASIGFVSGELDNGENVANMFSFTAATPGTWGDSITVRTNSNSAGSTVGFDILDNGIIVEQFTGDTINASTAFIENVINANSDFVRTEYLGGVGDSVPSGLETDLTGGDSGSFVTDSEVINAIDLYDNKEEIDINLFSTPGYSSTNVLVALNSITNTREDMFVLVDPPVGFTPQQVTNWHNGVAGSGNTFKLDNKYMGLFWPWVRINDNLNGLVRLVPPSVVMLELMAKNDNEQFPFTAPAGTAAGKISRALSIERQASQTERDLMYSDQEANNVNPIINLLGRGIVVFGQKSLQREFTSLNRINVARLIIYVRRKIKDIALDLVFQPNDSTTWDVFVSASTKFLQTLVTERGIVEFKVVMDSTTNTPQTIAQNKLYGFVQIKPRLVAEQIILTFQVVGQDFQFTN